MACAGGWPASLGASAADAEHSIGDYVNEAARVEVSDAVGVRHQPEALLRLMRSVARSVSIEANVTRLAADAGGETPLARGTHNRRARSWRLGVNGCAATAADMGPCGVDLAWVDDGDPPDDLRR